MTGMYPRRLYRFERATRKRVDTLAAKSLWAAKPKHFNDLTDCQLNLDTFSGLRWDIAALGKAIDALYPGGAVQEDFPLAAEVVEELRKLLRLRGATLRKVCKTPGRSV
jgi:hypothetical protein